MKYKLEAEYLHKLLSFEDLQLMLDYVGDPLKPDVTLMPDGDPYLYRYHIRYNNEHGNLFFHLQVKSDPERPLHDHPWENSSVILAGGYDEIWTPHPEDAWTQEKPVRFLTHRRKGDMVSRTAETAHRLILPPSIPYTMTLFTTGPKTREWGFWYPDGFHHNKRHVNDRGDGTSLGHHDHKEGE